MKLKYIATLATASILTIGGTAFFSDAAVSSTFDSKASTVIAGNPCAAENPCAAVDVDNPCAAENPCAAVEVDNPCAAADPCAGY